MIGVVSNNHVVNPSVYKNIPFDSLADITPITIIGATPFVLVAHPSVPAKNVQELIALAIGVAQRCDGCIGFHTKALVQMGCSEAELQEMLGVAVYMGGGPSLMYAANALAAFQQFSQRLIRLSILTDGARRHNVTHFNIVQIQNIANHPLFIFVEFIQLTA